MNEMNRAFVAAIMPRKNPIPYCLVYTDKAGNDRKTETYTAQTINMVVEEYGAFAGLYIMDSETGEIFNVGERVPMYR